jgi:F-box-like
MKRSHESDTVHCRGKLQRNEEDMPGLSTSTPANMDIVPDEVLASIIRLLPWRERIASVERVSRRWRRVALERGWSDFTVFNSRECIAPRGRN